MPLPGPGPLDAVAATALDVAQEDPQRARALAEGVLAAAPPGSGDEAAAVAHHALGLVARINKDVNGAIRHLDDAIRLADAGGHRRVAGTARISQAAAHSYRGDTKAALARLDEAIPLVDGCDRALIALQRAGILARVGRQDEALLVSNQAIQAFRQLGDVLREARALNNRGLLHAQRDDLGRADADLARAQQLREALGHVVGSADPCHNRGIVAGRRGDVPAALALFDEAERRYQSAGVAMGPLALDRCEVLLAAGLVHDAHTVATRAIEETRAGGMDAELAQYLLVLSSAALLDGDTPGATAAAGEALTRLLVQGHRPRSLLARLALARCRWAAGHRSASALRSIRAVAAELDALGMTPAAVDAHTLAGELALALGCTQIGRRELGAAAKSRNRGTAATRLRAWHAEALRRQSIGDLRGAASAVRAALAVAESRQANLGATELRSQIAGHAAQVVALGLGLALGTAEPRQVLASIERGRATSFRLPPVRPPADPRHATDLAELRRVVATVRTATERAPLGALLRRQRELEDAVRRQTWRATPSRVSHAAVSSADELGAALGDRVLIEIAESGGTLHAVVRAARRWGLHALAEAETVTAELRQLRFSMRQLVVAGPSSRARSGMARAATNVDELLLGPIRMRLGDHPVIIVPTGALHAVPWATLPTLARREVTVAPSASLWHRAATGPPGGGSTTLLVAGPGLPEATAEVEELRALYRGSVHLTGDAATTTAVTAALDGADLAHIAAHADFRSDNALFSCVELADGPLTVYDLEGVRRPPATVVLSGCQSGLSAVRAGDEVMGLVAALLSLGTRTVIAAVLPVPDTDCRTFTVAVHRSLIAGRSPPGALVSARAHVSDENLAGGAFVCFGAG